MQSESDISVFIPHPNRSMTWETRGCAATLPISASGLTGTLATTIPPSLSFFACCLITQPMVGQPHMAAHGTAQHYRASDPANTRPPPPLVARPGNPCPPLPPCTPHEAGDHRSGDSGSCGSLRTRTRTMDPSAQLVPGGGGARGARGAPPGCCELNVSTHRHPAAPAPPPTPPPPPAPIACPCFAPD